MEICLFRPKEYPLSSIKVKVNKIASIPCTGVTIQKCFIDIDEFMRYTYSVLPDTKLFMPEILFLKDVPLIFSPSHLLTATNAKYKVKVITNSSTADWLIVDSRYSLPPSLTEHTVCRHLVDMLKEYEALKLIETL